MGWISWMIIVVGVWLSINVIAFYLLNRTKKTERYWED